MSFLPVQKQSDGFNCGPFAIAYAAEILNGKSPIEAQFDAAKKRGYLISCLEKHSLRVLDGIETNHEHKSFICT